MSRYPTESLPRLVGLCDVTLSILVPAMLGSDSVLIVQAPRLPHVYDWYGSRHTPSQGQISNRAQVEPSTYTVYTSYFTKIEKRSRSLLKDQIKVVR